MECTTNIIPSGKTLVQKLINLPKKILIDIFTELVSFYSLYISFTIEGNKKEYVLGIRHSHSTPNFNYNKAKVFII